MPRLQLPTVQRWDCHNCGGCCKEYHVHVTPAERARIEGQGWASDPLYGNTPLFESARGSDDRLATRDDGSCVFLSPEGRCRIHERFGLQAKPLACQIYPYVLVPVGSGWRVSFRYACPSAIDNLGPAIGAARGELERFAAGIAAREGASGPVAAPLLQPGQALEWADLERFNRTFVSLLLDGTLTLPQRMIACVELVRLCREANFAQVRGGRLDDFLVLVRASVVADASTETGVHQPGGLAGVLFRQLASVLLRRDTGPNAGVARRGRFVLLAAAVRFALGRGGVPKLHAAMPDVTFADLERPAGPLSPVVVELLVRYYCTKIESFQFCGPSNFGMGVWDGMLSLLATFPAVLWMARGYRDRSRDDAVKQSLRMVDDNFAYNALLGTGRQRWAVRHLGQSGDLRQLIGWYGR